MLSYLSNRQYKKITECLPELLQADQPQTVYLPSYANPIQKQAALTEINNTGDLKKSGKLKLKKKAKVVESNFLGDCCPTCFSPDNITVKYYSHRHVCVNCRKFLRDEHGNQIKLFVNKQGDIICLGIYKMHEQLIEIPQGGFNISIQDAKKKQQAELLKKKFGKLNANLDHQVYYHTDYMKLFCNGKSSFATFAAQDEMIVLLRGQQ